MSEQAIEHVKLITQMKKVFMESLMHSKQNRFQVTISQNSKHQTFNMIELTPGILKRNRQMNFFVHCGSSELGSITAKINTEVSFGQVADQQDDINFLKDIHIKFLNFYIKQLEVKFEDLLRDYLKLSKDDDKQRSENERTIRKLRSKLVNKYLRPAVIKQYHEMMLRVGCMEKLGLNENDIIPKQKYRYGEGSRKQFQADKELFKEYVAAKKYLIDRYPEDAKYRNHLRFYDKFREIPYIEALELEPWSSPLSDRDRKTSAQSSDFGDIYDGNQESYGIDSYRDQQQYLSANVIGYKDGSDILYHQFLDLEILIFLVMFACIIGLFCCVAGYVVTKALEKRKRNEGGDEDILNQ